MSATEHAAARIRRATEQEIDTARAWVAELMGEAPEVDVDEPSTFAHADAWATDAQGEYEHALEILIFANGGREAEQTKGATEMSTDNAWSPINAAHRLAPIPETRDTATRNAWVRHYAAQALAANALLLAECRCLPPNPQPGSRPDIGYLAMVAHASMAAAAAFLGPLDAPTLLWDLTPELGALNGEWEEWLVDVLIRYGINPGHIDQAYSPADFTPQEQQ